MPLHLLITFCIPPYLRVAYVVHIGKHKSFDSFLIITLTGSQKQQNLERILNNQRRSRARRKEYQQELEARLRNYELQGTGASREIQEAARRVADENNKLRSLLIQNGIKDDMIVAYLQSSPTSDNVMDNNTIQSTELHQTRNTTYLDRNICTPVKSVAGEPGCLDLSTGFNTFSLECYLPANNKGLETFSLFVTNERSCQAAGFSGMVAPGAERITLAAVLLLLFTSKGEQGPTSQM
jgi:hypothetical protein